MIYLVSGDEYEQRYICAAFSTKEAAETYVAQKNAEYSKEVYNQRRPGDYYQLAEEVTLDEYLVGNGPVAA